MPQAPKQQSMPKVNAAFAILLVGMVGYFIFWGLGYTHHHQVALFLLATLLGVFMVWHIRGRRHAHRAASPAGGRRV